MFDSDYHIHYYLDKCANASMTFENIEEEAHRLGLEEITVLKHYSHAMPNGEADWVCWHRIIPEQFERFLSEREAYKQKYPIKLFTGVETELVNEKGDINIPDSDLARVDMGALSVHYMITLDCLDMDLMLYPNLAFCPNDNNDAGRAVVERWRVKANKVGAERIVKGLVNAYVNAIERHPRVRTLAHINDGVMPLTTYLIDIPSIDSELLPRLFDPLYETMKATGVKWEIAGNCRYESIVRRARDAGVEFAVTADSHFISGGWANLCERGKVVDYATKLLNT